ncbi:uncharacterized protein LOC105208957 isoform X2 [Zeugodacus cucurbitae]|uniref:uncharacterized protein LOC105208957 isoform X2 n=1 Tax=Zeugodacus cucurbitae TaxID=28588 RepID=UPI0010A7479E|nr:uncharacterized protein LOC105208957 isoform X2 [Zeugodacus cucurbitae]
MGFRYQELKDRGDSIELERKESYTTERSHNGYIKRHKTVVRERFPHPNAKEARKQQKQHAKRSAFSKTQRPEAASEHTATETFGNSPESGALLTTCRDKSHLERAVNRTSVQLKRLAHEIDNEIAKLKRERDKLMFRTRPHPLMRNAAIQNDLHTNIEPLDKLKEIDTQFAKNIEFTIEKFSSQHKFVCTSPRYARDEQTSCRPRMRTIGLQKDTQRGAVEDNLQNLKAKLSAAINYSGTNLADLKSKGLLDTAPPNCYAFDYGGTGDGQTALNVYHLQNCRFAGGCNDCNCAKNCERYNSVGNYNGMLCNKNSYVEKGLTPCKEYKYCRDEYHYNYPSQNKCVVPVANQPCSPCVPSYQSCQPCQPYQPCQPCIPCLPPCPLYGECQPAKHKEKVIYGRRMSDLNTEDFYHPTSSRSAKHSPNKHGSPRHSKNKERLTVDVPKDGRTFVDIERSGEPSRSKTRRKNESEGKTRQRSSKTYDDVSARKANEKRQVRERKPRQESESSGSVDSSEKARQMKSKEKLLEITFTKERRHRPSSESGEECIMYEMPKPCREYSRETKRSLKQMTITAYKPCKPVDSEGKKKQKDKGQGADDDKTWDERLRHAEYPAEEDDWHAGVPTITEVYDDYRVGDTYPVEGHKIIQEPTESPFVGGYREMYRVSPQRSYDIMPVQKNTVRDIPPSQSPDRERRTERERPTRPSERLRESYERDRTASGTGPDGQRRIGRDGRQRDSIDKERSEVYRAYGLEGKPGRSYGRTYDERRSPDDYGRSRQGDERYDPKFTTSTPRSARDYERGIKSEQRYDSRGQPRKIYDEPSAVPGRAYTPDGTPRSGRYARGVEQDDNIKMEAFSPSTSQDKYISSEKLDRKRTPRDVISSSDQRVGNDAQHTGERKFKQEDKLMQDEDTGLSSKKPEISATDMKFKADTEKPDDMSHKAKVKMESPDSPAASTPRTGKGPISDRGLIGDEQTMGNVPQVPEIKIEDTDESGRSAPSGRGGKPEGKREQEPQSTRSPKKEQIGSSPGRKPEVYAGTVSGTGFARSDAPGVMGAAASPLSPFPSLETPKIYMKPRALCTDYGKACFPPIEEECPKRTSPRANCVANAGDAYMCQACNRQTACASPSPCQCSCAAESGSEIPYEKLGDQYTHSPVRQLAANSHLAVALQSDIAANNYKPLPQESLSKSCITLRSTGTQYSATIIERQEDRCAPQYVPLPKVCSEILAEEAQNSATQSTCTCDESRRNNKPPCSSPDNTKNKYQFLCEEANEEYDAKMNLQNNEQWCGRVEINTEKRQIFIAQPKQEAEEKNYLLPWQQDEKFIPGQPISTCNTSPWQDGSVKFMQTVSKIPRYQNYAERRTPRFNATMPPHQEMPEEEDRCAQELPQYKPQTRVQFMEQYESCDPCCYARNEANLQNEAADCMHEYTPRGRLSFAYGGEYQQIPEFTGCPCMFKTYLNMVTLYYPDCRVQLREDCVEIDEDDEFNE